MEYNSFVLTKKEALFIAGLLDMAAEEWSNKTCDELDSGLEDIFTFQKEKEELSKAFFDWMDPEEYEPGYFYGGAGEWMCFFSEKLKGEIK